MLNSFASRIFSALSAANIFLPSFFTTSTSVTRFFKSFLSFSEWRLILCVSLLAQFLQQLSGFLFVLHSHLSLISSPTVSLQDPPWPLHSVSYVLCVFVVRSSFSQSPKELHQIHSNWIPWEALIVDGNRFMLI